MELVAWRRRYPNARIARIASEDVLKALPALIRDDELIRSLAVASAVDAVASAVAAVASAVDELSIPKKNWG